VTGEAPSAGAKGTTFVARNYGSDPSGQVCGFVFGADRPGEEIATDEALRWLADGKAGDDGAFVWLHFDLTRASAERWLRDHLDLASGFFDALHEGSTSTRIELEGGRMVVVVNDVLYDFGFEATHLATLWVCADRRLVVSARRKPLRSIDRLRVAVLGGEAFRSPASLLVHLLRDQADVLIAIVRDATDRVDGIEDSLLAGRLDTKRANLGALRRVLVRLQRLLAPEPAALFRLLNEPPSWVPDADIVALRHSTEEFSAVLADMAALLERVKLLQEEIGDQIREDGNRLLMLLSVLTVTGLPFTVVGGLFGMNVGGIPLAGDAAGFWIIVGMVAIATAAGTWILFRWRRR